MNFLKDKISHILHRDCIKMAVIGATSSGKTYLLTDMLVALSRMGYVPESDENSQFRHIASFIPDVNGDEGIAKTPIYACRNENRYASKMVNNQLGRSFELHFVDVPGEVITNNSIMEFQGIKMALRKCKSKIFRVVTWREKGGKGIKRTVSYKDSDYSQDDDQQNDNTTGSGIHLEGDSNNAFSSETKLFGTSNSGYRTKDYVSTRKIQERLGNTHTAEKQEYISGRELYDHFYDYITDTVMQSIVEAWDALDVDSELMLDMNEIVEGINPTDSPRDRFNNVYKNHFYFHYYTYDATDVIICDKMALPQGVSVNLTKDTFGSMIRSLSSLVSSKDVPRKTWHMAFRGVDSILQQSYLQNLFQNTDHNTLYSFFSLMMAQYLCHEVTTDSMEQEADPDIFGPKKHANPKVANADELWDMISSNEVGQLAQVCYDQYCNFSNVMTNYFHQPHEYRVLTNTDTLRTHVNRRHRAFMTLANITKLPDDPVARVLNLIPHVYFTSSAIDEEFNICKHSAEDETVFTGMAAEPYCRLCFGTFQLTSDILLSHGKSIPDEACQYGSILDYLYQN